MTHPAYVPVKISSLAVTSTASLLFPFTKDLSNQGIYTSFPNSNVSITFGATEFASYSSKLGVNNGSITISGLYATNLFRNGYTIAMWVYLRNNIGDWNTSPITVYDNANAMIFTWNPCNAPWNRTVAGLYFQNNSNNISANYSANNDWQQLVVTVSSSKLCTYYINGYNWGTTTPTNILGLDYLTLFPNPSNTWGTAYPTPGRFLSVFNTALSSSQVTQMYNEQTTV